ncbi:hypothetical protein C1701_22610 [Actinoalloteichus sp. AHMU CJ021]|nr:hypothetical protein C1701_22610 [Actinoalloteichus sp. AHMU CJ021]
MVLAVVLAVVAVALVVLAVAVRRALRAARRTSAARSRLSARFADRGGLLRARTAALKVAVAERRGTSNTRGSRREA